MDADDRNDIQWVKDREADAAYKAGKAQYERDLGGISGAPAWEDLDGHWQILFERKAAANDREGRSNG